MSAQLMKVFYSRLFLSGLLLAAAGGCSESMPTSPSATVTSPAPPPPPPAPPEASAPQRLAALALFESASLHAALTTSPLNSAAEDGKVWFNGPCAAGSGSLQGSLDGGLSPTSGTFLPTGSHTYVVSFTNCVVDYLSGIELNGVASAAYTAADWSNITATVSADSVRGTGLAYLSELHDVTGDGSAVWTSVGSSRKTITYTPAPGSRLVNNSTANVATFGGGSYSRTHPPPPQGTSSRVEQRFVNLKVAINGTEYTLDGSLDTTYGFAGSGGTNTGEIRIINNGALVARIYGDARNALAIEVLVPLVPL